MTKKKTHWAEAANPTDVLQLTLCGRLEPVVAMSPDDVTCHVCKARLPGLATAHQSIAEAVEVAFSPRPVTEYELRPQSPPPPLFDPLTGLPSVTRENWRSLRCRCQSCPTCRHFLQLAAEATARPWQKTHRPHNTYRWTSVTAALEWYADIEQLGYPETGLGEVLIRLGKLGCVVRGGDRETQALRAAWDHLALDQALAACYRGPSGRGLSRSERLYVLFSVCVGQYQAGQRAPRKAHAVAEDLNHHNLTGPMVTAIAAEGRRTVRAELQTRELLPMSA